MNLYYVLKIWNFIMFLIVKCIKNSFYNFAKFRIYFYYWKKNYFKISINDKKKNNIKLIIKIL